MHSGSACASRPVQSKCRWWWTIQAIAMAWLHWESTSVQPSQPVATDTDGVAPTDTTGTATPRSRSRPATPAPQATSAAASARESTQFQNAVPGALNQTVVTGLRRGTTPAMPSRSDSMTRRTSDLTLSTLSPGQLYALPEWLYSPLNLPRCTTARHQHGCRCSDCPFPFSPGNCSSRHRSLTSHGGTTPR